MRSRYNWSETKIDYKVKRIKELEVEVGVFGVRL